MNRYTLFNKYVNDLSKRTRTVGVSKQQSVDIYTGLADPPEREISSFGKGCKSSTQTRLDTVMRLSNTILAKIKVQVLLLFPVQNSIFL